MQAIKARSDADLIKPCVKLHRIGFFKVKFVQTCGKQNCGVFVRAEIFLQTSLPCSIAVKHKIVIFRGFR